MNIRTTSNHPAEPAHAANASEFEALLRTAMDALMIKTRAHQDAWGFGQEEEWFLDHGSGELVFTFPDVTVSAPAQVIGSWQQDTGIWTWAWADPNLPAHLQEDAHALREYGEQNGFQHLVSESWQAEESHCWYMTALACWLCDAKGAYRGVTDNTWTFMVFREVVQDCMSEVPQDAAIQAFLTSAVEEFQVCNAFPEEQRKACCRYLYRGALEGIDQAELIHRLGLAAPSVLDLAGYSPEASQNLMDILKTISDDEIQSYAHETAQPGPDPAA